MLHRLCRPRTAQSETGFTLIELVLVILLMGILAATAAPRFFDNNVFQERGYFDETLAALRYAQKLAVASGCEVQATVNAGGFQLRQRSNCSAGQPFAQTITNPGGCRIPAVPAANDFDCNAPAGVSVAGAPYVVTFNALGQASSALSFGIGTRTIQVVAETGFVYSP